MTRPAYAAVGARSNSSGATFRTPALPAGVTAGDVLICIAGAKSADVHSIGGGGWQAITSQSNPGGSYTISLWWRIADGTEAEPTISWASSVACFAQVKRYTRDVDPAGGSPFGTISAAATGSASPHSVSGINASKNNSLIAYVGAAAANTGYAVPSGGTENIDNGAASSLTRNVCGYKTDAIAAGDASGAITMAGPAAAWALWLIEITEPTILGAAAGALDIGGTATAAALAAGTAAGGIGISGSATGAAMASGQASGEIGLAGSAEGAAAVTGAAAGSIGLSGAVEGAAPVQGAASGALGLSGEATAAAGVSGSAAGSIGLSGTATGTAEDVVAPPAMFEAAGRWCRHVAAGRWQRITATGRWARHQVQGQWRQP